MLNKNNHILSHKNDDNKPFFSSKHWTTSTYRDLKPENVLFFEKLGIIKLTDFGFSNKFCPGQKLETSCGSLAYSAPEILLGDSYDAPAVGEYKNNN